MLTFLNCKNLHVTLENTSIIISGFNKTNMYIFVVLLFFHTLILLATEINIFFSCCNTKPFQKTSPIDKQTDAGLLGAGYTY